MRPSNACGIPGPGSHHPQAASTEAAKDFATPVCDLMPGCLVRRARDLVNRGIVSYTVTVTVHEPKLENFADVEEEATF